MAKPKSPNATAKSAQAKASTAGAEKETTNTSGATEQPQASATDAGIANAAADAATTPQSGSNDNPSEAGAKADKEAAQAGGATASTDTVVATTFNSGAEGEMEVLFIRSVAKTGSRRCGYRWPHEGMGIERALLTEDQIAALHTDPRLKVEEGTIDLADAETLAHVIKAAARDRRPVDHHPV